jgi:hypothetical protein
MLQGNFNAHIPNGIFIIVIVIVIVSRFIMSAWRTLITQQEQIRDVCDVRHERLKNIR